MIGLGLVHIGSEGAVKACANARLLRAWLGQLGTAFVPERSQDVPGFRGMPQLEGTQ